MKFELNWPSDSEERMFENVDGQTLLQLDTSWVLTVLEKVAKKASVPNKYQVFLRNKPHFE